MHIKKRKKRGREMFCTECGKEMPEGTKFCTNCGMVMEEETPEVVETEKRRRFPGWAIALIIAGAGTLTFGIVIIIVSMVIAGVVFNWNVKAPTVEFPEVIEEEYEEDDYEYEDEDEDEIDYSYSDSKQDYVLPQSSYEYITESDLYGLTEEECRIARNEIYARHGRMFKDAELQAYFNSKSWYTPLIPADSFQESMLNAYEKENKDVILEYERARGWN